LNPRIARAQVYGYVYRLHLKRQLQVPTHQDRAALHIQLVSKYKDGISFLELMTQMHIIPDDT
jgi:hypothetical protein